MHKTTRDRPIPIQRHIRILFLKWHRSIGVFSAGFMFFLALSGLVLNHAHTIGLDKQSIHLKPLLSWYGIEIQTSHSGYSFGNSWLSNQQNSLYWNDKKIIECLKLQTALLYQSFILALCSEKIIVLTTKGLIVEVISELPEQLVDIASMPKNNEANPFLLLQGEFKNYHFDLENLKFTPVDVIFSTTNKVKTGVLPSPLLSRLNNIATDHSITWERLLLDLHSGRFFGQAGIILVDLLALMFIFLSISGAWLWLRRH